jgi:hypothetical protein
MTLWNVPLWRWIASELTPVVLRFTGEKPHPWTGNYLEILNGAVTPVNRPMKALLNLRSVELTTVLPSINHL